MFTGIVEEIGKVVNLTNKVTDLDLSIKAPKVSAMLNIGDSISVNGIFLTAREIEGDIFKVSAAYETLKLTNLSDLQIDHLVNLETSLTPNKAMGGHLVQGHISDTTTIIDICNKGESVYLKFNKPKHLDQYIVKKGYITIDGVSLTICEEGQDYFEVMIIPHTLNATIANSYEMNKKVNLEIDIIGRYLEKLYKKTS